MTFASSFKTGLMVGLAAAGAAAVALMVTRRQRGAAARGLTSTTPRTTIPSTRRQPSPSRRATLLRMRRHLARRPTGKQEQRRLAVGAEPRADGTHFRVWAPSSSSVAVVLSEPGGQPIGTARPADSDEDGYFQGLVAGAQPGTLYWIALEDGSRFADPASRFQPNGPHGPSEVIDPHAFPWTDAEWPGIGEREPDRLRDARRHLHVRRHVCVGEPRTGRPREARRVDHRGPAARRVSRPIRVGVRRCSGFCADAAVRTSRRLQALRQRGARARPRRGPRRRLQPLWP